ncbi:MAG: hypothetical protein HYZ28_20295 [Myxococcales bacterium]|nr:hypothetical protein [Myxococcales bacterium]
MRTAPRLLLSLLAALSGCGGPRRTGTAPTSPIGEDPVSHVELTISNLTQAEAEAFKEQVRDQGGVENVALKSFQQGTAVYELDVKGCECELPSKVVAIQALGFKYQGRVSRLSFSAFDNQPPKVAFVHPEEGKVVTDPEQHIAVEVPDQDVAEVAVNGSRAERYKGNIWRVKLRLAEGVNDLLAVAKDKTGNEGKAQVRVAVDTRPPALEATVRVVVEGQVDPGSSVLIDGREVSVEPNGRYKAEVPVRKGQKQIEIVAIDANGNKVVTMKDIGL